MASQITSLTVVYSTVYSGADQRKHQSSASLAFVVTGAGEFPAQWPVTRKIFPFDDAIMNTANFLIKSWQYTSPSSSIRARYVVSFMSSMPEQYHSTLAVVVLYAIPCSMGPWYIENLQNITYFCLGTIIHPY